MDASDVLLYVVASAAGVIVVTACVFVVWRAAGIYLIRKAGPRPLRASKHVLWRDPGDVAARDLTAGPGGPDGAPQPPFRFVEEHQSGSQPCVSVTDGRGRRWRVKWGEEVRSENFAVRLAWAIGYFAEVTYYVHDGIIERAGDLKRTRTCIDESGRFKEARFELDDSKVRKHFEEHSWAWNDNPFVGTRELNGLRILVMLLSNWDAKDRRDVARGSNTAIFEHRLSRWKHEAWYLITDWGGSMGRWGTVVTRGRWDPDGFEAQTPNFMTSTPEGAVTFGYSGQRTTDITAGLTAADVRWLHGYLGRLSDAQIEDALRASGASADETGRYLRAIRERITQLGRVNTGSATPT